MKESFLFLAEGFEEIEALTAVDVLRRAGMPVKTVSITSSPLVTGAHGITVKADSVAIILQIRHGLFYRADFPVQIICMIMLRCLVFSEVRPSPVKAG